MFGRSLKAICQLSGDSFCMAHQTATASSAHHGSFWPLVVTLGILLLLGGILVPWLALAGLGVLVVAIVGWIREDVGELSTAPRVTGRSDYWYAAVFLIASEVVLFGVLFTYYFWVRSYSLLWPPPEIPEADPNCIRKIMSRSRTRTQPSSPASSRSSSSWAQAWGPLMPEAHDEQPGGASPCAASGTRGRAVGPRGQMIRAPQWAFIDFMQVEEFPRPRPRKTGLL